MTKVPHFRFVLDRTIGHQKLRVLCTQGSDSNRCVIASLPRCTLFSLIVSRLSIISLRISSFMSSLAVYSRGTRGDIAHRIS